MENWAPLPPYKDPLRQTWLMLYWNIKVLATWEFFEQKTRIIHRFFHLTLLALQKLYCQSHYLSLEWNCWSLCATKVACGNVKVKSNFLNQIPRQLAVSFLLRRIGGLSSERVNNLVSDGWKDWKLPSKWTVWCKKKLLFSKQNIS